MISVDQSAIDHKQLQNEGDKLKFSMYVQIVAIVAIVLVMLMLCVTAYNIADRVGPVRPMESNMYYWPK